MSELIGTMAGRESDGVRLALLVKLEFRGVDSNAALAAANDEPANPQHSHIFSGSSPEGSASKHRQIGIRSLSPPDWRGYRFAGRSRLAADVLPLARRAGAIYKPAQVIGAARFVSPVLDNQAQPRFSVRPRGKIRSL